MIEARNLVKRYGSTTAVNDLSFSIRPGVVTGFLGPNGAGKTTTMRMILGLDAPTRGSVTVGGRSYRDLPAPMREVGALLDARALHGGRRARDHLLCLAHSNGIPRRRVDEVLRTVGLEDVARRRVLVRDDPHQPDRRPEARPGTGSQVAGLRRGDLRRGRGHQLHGVLRGPGPHQRPCPPRGARRSRGSPGGGGSRAVPDRPGGVQRRRRDLAPAPGPPPSPA